MVNINNGEHDSPHELPKENSEGSLNIDNAVYTNTDLATKLLEEIEKLEYIYQHFQDCEKIHKTDPHYQQNTLMIPYTLRLTMTSNMVYLKM